MYNLDSTVRNVDKQINIMDWKFLREKWKSEKFPRSISLNSIFPTTFKNNTFLRVNKIG